MTVAFLPAVAPETTLFQWAFQRSVFPPLFPIAGRSGKSVILPPIRLPSREAKNHRAVIVDRQS